MSDKKKLPYAVAEQLEKTIRNNMKPGDRLQTEKELAAGYHVGRSTIREALNSLCTKGIIERRNRGTFVTEEAAYISRENAVNLELRLYTDKVSDLLEIRHILDCQCVEMVIDRLKEESELIELERIHWRMQNPDATAEEYIVDDTAFHTELGKLSHNMLMEQMIRQFRLYMSQIQLDYDLDVSFRRSSILSHGELIEAIRTRNKKKAFKCVEEQTRITKTTHEGGTIDWRSEEK